MTKEEYHAFLETEEWKPFSKNFKLQVGGRCELCGSRINLNTHHMNYDDLYDISKLKCLCKKCHNITHKMLDQYFDTFKYPNFVDRAELDEFLGNVFIDFYINSYCSIGTDSKVNLLELNELRKLGNFILQSIDEKYGKYKNIQVFSKWGILHNSITETSYIDIARHAIVRERNRQIKEAILEGFPEYTIQKRFKMNYNSWQKALSHIDWKKRE